MLSSFAEESQTIQHEKAASLVGGLSQVVSHAPVLGHMAKGLRRRIGDALLRPIRKADIATNGAITKADDAGAKFYNDWFAAGQHNQAAGLAWWLPGITAAQRAATIGSGVVSAPGVYKGVKGAVQIYRGGTP